MTHGYIAKINPKMCKWQKGSDRLNALIVWLNIFEKLTKIRKIRKKNTIKLTRSFRFRLTYTLLKRSEQVHLLKFTTQESYTRHAWCRSVYHCTNFFLMSKIKIIAITKLCFIGKHRVCNFKGKCIASIAMYSEYTVSILLTMIVRIGYRSLKKKDEIKWWRPISFPRSEKMFVLKVLLRVLGWDKGERRFVRREIGFCGW